jgi:hypothetical protein
VTKGDIILIYEFFIHLRPIDMTIKVEPGKLTWVTSYMHTIVGDESHGQLHLGGLIDWNYNVQYYENWDDSHIYWLNVYEIGPAARWSKIIKDNQQLALNFNFSLIALVSRPPKYRYYDQGRLPKEILSKPHEKMEFTSLHEYVSIGLNGNTYIW